MLRKEFSDVLRQVLFFTVLSLGIPLLVKAALWKQAIPYFDLLFLQFQFCLLGFVLFLGNSLFLTDRKQRAVDYLFSLPYTKLQLLGIKVLPRLVTVVVFYLVFRLLCHFGGDSLLIFSPVFYTFFYFTLFIIALSFSASMDNYILMAVVTLLGTILLSTLAFLIPWFILLVFFNIPIEYSFDFFFNSPPLSWGISFIVLRNLTPFLLPFLAAFILSYKKIGIGPLNRFNKRYVKIFTVLMAAGILISAVITYSIVESGSNTYYLTKQQQLLEANRLSCRLYDEDEVDTVVEGFVNYYQVIRPLEVDGSLYLFSSAHSNKNLVGVDLNTRRTETLYKGGGWGSWDVLRMWYFNKTIAFFEDYRFRDRKLILVHAETRKVKKIPLLDKLPSNYSGTTLFGADDFNGRRFWLIRSLNPVKHPLILVWEDGRVQNLGKTGIRPCYLNHTLITGDEKNLVFHRMTEAGMTPIKTMPVDKTFFINDYDYTRNNLDTASVKETYCYSFFQQNGRRWIPYYFQLDLETFEMKEMDAINEHVRRITEDLGYFVFRRSPSMYYYIELSRWGGRSDIRRVYELKEGALELVKEFLPKGDNLIRGQVFKSGIVIQEFDKVSVYAFPDLRELTFKRLKYEPRPIIIRGEDSKQPLPKTYEQKLETTKNNIKAVGAKIANYIKDFQHAPKADSIHGLKWISKLYGFKDCPRRDGWGRRLFYKYDEKNPGNYWIASSGSDGRLDRFDQQGTWDPHDDKGQDIVFFNGNFVYEPMKEIER